MGGIVFLIKMGRLATLARKSLHAWEGSFAFFCTRCPACFIAIFFLIGIGFYVFPRGVLYLLPLSFLSKKGKALSLICGGWFYAYLTFPSPLPTPLKGKGTFHINRVYPQRSHFTSSLVYEGTLKGVHLSDQKLYRLPCVIYWPASKNRHAPPAHCDYFFPEGELREGGRCRYIFKPKKWIPIPHSYSFAEKRWRWMENLRRYVKRHYSKGQERDLISGLITGHLDHQLITFYFAQLGLQHLLVISGFHFSLLSGLIWLVVKRCASTRTAIAMVLSLLFLYMISLGGRMPSISRAWVAVLVPLLGHIVHLRSNAINNFGLAMLTILVFDPLMIFCLGFQLTFSATLGLLLFYRPFERGLRTLLPKRPFNELLAFSLPDRCGYCVTAYLRNALALNGSVLTFLLPLLLFHWHRFPLLSLLYNLWVPTLFAGLMIGICLTWVIPPLHGLTAGYARCLMEMIVYAPKRLMFCVRIEEVPLDLLLLLFCGVWVIGIYWRTRVWLE